MHIRNSLIALFVQRLYGVQNSCMSKAVNRISSGSRINSAADDAAGLAISENVRARIRSLSAAIRNSEGATSLTQTAEGAMTSMHAVLQRMRELAVQSVSDTNGDTDRGVLDAEYQQLLEELDDIAEEARYNGKILLTGGSGSNPLSFLIQTGPDTGDSFGLVIEGVTTDVLSLSGTHLLDSASAADALFYLDGAIGRVSGGRAKLGAVQKRLECKMNNLATLAENLTEADSRIRDADIAEEMVRFTKARLLAHISSAMLSQANALAGNVLFLLANQMISLRISAADNTTGGAGSLVSGTSAEPETAQTVWVSVGGGSVSPKD